MDYQLLALDMDGTVLASDKTITPRTQMAIHRALAAGKEVLFATGRAPAEMREHLKNFPDMHYVICLAGATVVDLRTHTDLNVVRFSRETAQAIYSVGSRYDWWLDNVRCRNLHFLANFYLKKATVFQIN